MRRLRGSFCRRTDRDSGRYHLLDADPPFSYTLEKYEIPSGRVRLVLPDKTTWTAFDIWEESHFFFFFSQRAGLFMFFCYFASIIIIITVPLAARIFSYLPLLSFVGNFSARD